MRGFGQKAFLHKPHAESPGRFRIRVIDHHRVQQALAPHQSDMRRSEIPNALSELLAEFFGPLRHLLVL